MVNELRIGNYFRHGIGWSYRSSPDKITDEICRWDRNDLYALGNGTLTEDLIKRLRITEDLLLEFGFISNPYQDTYHKDGFILDCDQTSGEPVLYYRETEVKYVHRLQNLYFEVKNQELGALRL